jgi:hypothetical protein
MHPDLESNNIALNISDEIANLKLMIHAMSMFIWIIFVFIIYTFGANLYIIFVLLVGGLLVLDDTSSSILKIKPLSDKA